MNELQLVATAGQVELKNYPEWKAYVEQQVEQYKTSIIDPSGISQAKEKLAQLRKFKTSLNAERLAKEREYMLPFLTAKNQIADILGVVDEAIINLDTQVKAFDEAEKSAKKLEIEDLWNSKHFNLVKLDKIWKEEWLNRGSKLADISTALDEIIFKANSDIDSLILTCKGDEDKVKALMTIYTDKLDLGQALVEYERLEQAKIATSKALEERKQVSSVIAQPSVSPSPGPIANAKRGYVAFRVEDTIAKLGELSKFLKENGYKYTVTDKGEVK